MYADTSLLLPYFQSFSHEAHHLEEFCRNQRTCSSMGNFGQTSTVSDYDLGEEGDLFKAPEPIIEEPEMGLDPMTAISVVSCGEDAMSPQTMKLADLESFQSEQLLNEVFYECEKDLLAKSAIEEPFSDLSDVKIPVACMDVDPSVAKDGLLPEGPIQKSISSGCLRSMEWMHGTAPRPNFLDFQLVDFGDAYGMRRAFSEGDMQTLSCGNTSLTHSPFERPLTIGCYNIEERKQKLSRYRKKRTKRNFGRKIKVNDFSQLLSRYKKKRTKLPFVVHFICHFIRFWLPNGVDVSGDGMLNHAYFPEDRKTDQFFYYGVEPVFHFHKSTGMQFTNSFFQYACRKALADSQPRVRGRFAKTEELEVSKN